MKAQIFNYNIWMPETNPEVIKCRIKNIVELSGFGVESISEKYFEPQGYTLVYLLSESHLAIHTFPEEGTTYLELSSCVKKPFDKFIKYLTEYATSES
jgi:S-adenosylmethionine decarboxylase